MFNPYTMQMLTRGGFTPMRRFSTPSSMTTRPSMMTFGVPPNSAAMPYAPIACIPFQCSICHSVFLTEIEAKTHYEATHQSEKINFNTSDNDIGALPQATLTQMTPQTEMSNLERSRVSSAVPFFPVPAPMLFDTVLTTETTVESKRNNANAMLQMQQTTRCIRCSKTFNNAYTLRCHVIKRHASKRRPHPCVHCKARFVSPMKRATHVYIQHVLRRRKRTSFVPSRTESFGKKFAKTITQQIDLKPSNAAHRFSCEDCLFESNTKTELEQHTQSWHLGLSTLTETTSNTSKVLENAKSKRLQSKKDGFPCNQCDYVSRYKQNLRRHLLLHKKTITKTTSEPQASSLNERTRDESQQHGIMHRCDACDYTNRLKTNIILHLRRAHGIETEEKTPQQKALEEKIFRGDDHSYRCPECTFRGRKRHFVAKHIRLTHVDKGKDATNETIFRCEYCIYSTTNTENLYRHVRRTHRDAPRYSCPHARCNYGTILRLYLARHLQTCAAEGSSRKKDIDETHSTTSGSDSASSHSSNKQGEFACNQCAFKTEFKHNLRRHIRRNHTPIEDTFQCTECPMSYTTKDGLRRHIIVVHSIKSEPEVDRINQRTPVGRPLTCKLCAFRTTKMSTLRQHIQLRHASSQARIHTCTQCAYDTNDKDELIKHIKERHSTTETIKQEPSTTDDLLYRCQRCSYTTRIKRLLDEHLRTYPSHERTTTITKAERPPTPKKIKHDEKRFKCCECRYATNKRSALAQHLRIVHSTDSQSYDCSHCQFTSKYKQNLVRHVSIAHAQ